MKELQICWARKSGSDENVEEQSKKNTFQVLNCKEKITDMNCVKNMKLV